jgi:hypothetical protein
MTPSTTHAFVDLADVITGMRYGLSFGAKGRCHSVKKLTNKCRDVMKRIPAATGCPPRRDGVISLSPRRREMEQRWCELSLLIQGACVRCPYHARGQCRGARFD